MKLDRAGLLEQAPRHGLDVHGELLYRHAACEMLRTQVSRVSDLVTDTNKTAFSDFMSARVYSSFCDGPAIF